MMIDTKDIERRIYDRVVRGGDQLLASIAHECVDHIDSLLMENERLRKALEHIANDKPPLGHMAVMIDYHHLKRIAQDALAQKEPDDD